MKGRGPFESLCETHPAERLAVWEEMDPHPQFIGKGCYYSPFEVKIKNGRFPVVSLCLDFLNCCCSGPPTQAQVYQKLAEQKYVADWSADKDEAVGGDVLFLNMGLDLEVEQ